MDNLAHILLPPYVPYTGRAPDKGQDGVLKTFWGEAHPLILPAYVKAGMSVTMKIGQV